MASSSTADTALTPFARALGYRLVSVMLHQPGLLRLIAAAHRRWPFLSALTGIVARRDAVIEAFLREHNFSSTAHAPNMPAGEFVMGMESGPRHAVDRDFFEKILPDPSVFALRSGEEAMQRVEALRTRADGRFDLVEDYMVWVAWRALREAFGDAAAAFESHMARGSTQDAGMRSFFHELRYLGSQLIVGGTAPRAIASRAERSGGAMRRQVEQTLPELKCAWAHLGAKEDVLRRNAVGLGWTSHPATVQACALMTQELLKRPLVYRKLRERAQSLGESAWTDAPFRSMLRDHVLELMRFRPTFPMLTRDVPRDTSLRVSERRRIDLRGGSQLVLLSIGAMFDPRAVSHPRSYCPERHGRSEDAMLHFGFGPRTCAGSVQVVEVLIGALTGLLLMPPLRWADPWWSRIGYDGPIVVRMRLRFDTP